MADPAMDFYWGTGRRKTSVARVRLREGKGAFVVNGEPVAEYFGRGVLEMIVRRPFSETQSDGRFDVFVNVTGGGKAGQAGAVRHGISRALLEVDAAYREPLKRAGLLTRDPRMKERRKYGLKKARKAPQFSKR